MAKNTDQVRKKGLKPVEIDMSERHMLDRATGVTGVR